MVKASAVVNAGYILSITPAGIGILIVQEKMYCILCTGSGLAQTGRPGLGDLVFQGHQIVVTQVSGFIFN